MRLFTSLMSENAGRISIKFCYEVFTRSNYNYDDNYENYTEDNA